MSLGHEQAPRPGDRRPHRPSDKIGEAADDALYAPVTAPGIRVSASCDRQTVPPTPQTKVNRLPETFAARALAPVGLLAN